MVVVGKLARKGTATPRYLTARLLVLGDKQVGKSASIVRYTTGRYIQEYGQSGSTSDWLYRHLLSFDAAAAAATAAKRSSLVSSVELLEQKDIQFSNSANFFASSCTPVSSLNTSRNTAGSIATTTDSTAGNPPPTPKSLLASRVALDQQIDLELHEKQQMMTKLHWANAYVVIYAINDVSTFNKAIKYLNLIANNINSPLDGSSPTSGGGGGSGCASSGIGSGSSSSGSGGSEGSRLSPAAGLSHARISPCHNGAHANSGTCVGCTGIARRPILLLGNKSDLEKGGARQVSTADGRFLAVRHQSMFAEISIAESSKLIETVLANLIEQIDPAAMHSSEQHAVQQQQQVQHELSPHNNGGLSKWTPSVELALGQPSSLASPVWGSLVKSQAIGATTVQSSRVAGVPRLETDVRLIKPIGSVAQSVAIVGPRPKPMACYSVESSVGAKRGAGGGRYASLKSSFKRASMAIVSSKGGLVAKAGGHRDSSSSSASVGTATAGLVTRAHSASQDALPVTMAAAATETIANCNECGTHSNWFKSHISSFGSHHHNKHMQPVTTISSSSDPKLNISLSAAAAATCSQSSVALNGCDKKQRTPPPASRRPLFRYKSRRKTVAFEQIGACAGVASVVGSGTSSNSVPMVATSCSVARAEQMPVARGELAAVAATRAQLAPSAERANSSSGYTSTRCSSGRSSSSLSTYSDTYNYSSSPIFIASGGSSTTQARTPSVCSSSSAATRITYTLGAGHRDSRSTISRASTSGGSYEIDDSSDEAAAAAAMLSPILVKTIPVLASHSVAVTAAAGAQLPPLAPTTPTPLTTKKRYQLVKSVQSTLTNLTRSSNISAQAAKRSFCNTLLRYSSSSGAAPTFKTTSAPITTIAKTEQIRTMPIVGYCN